MTKSQEASREKKKKKADIPNWGGINLIKSEGRQRQKKE